MKRYNVLVFLNVNVALIYVAIVAQWDAVNKKSNVLIVNYYIDIDDINDNDEFEFKLDLLEK